MLIGITGKANAGKDSVGNAINDHLGGKMTHMSFAKPLKIMVATFLSQTGIVPGCNYLQFEDRGWKETKLREIDKSPRDLLLTAGTEWGRNLVDDDVWLIAAEYAYSQIVKKELGVYFTDLRFENEAEWIRSHEGIIIEVRRTGGGDMNIQHASEDGIGEKDLDYLIEAESGDMESLRRQAVEAIQDAESFD